MPWSSTLAVAIDAAVETITLTTALTPRRGSNLIVCESEVMEAHGVGGTVMFVKRGALGSEPVAHAQGAAVTLYDAGQTGSGDHPNLTAHTDLGLAASHAHPYSADDHGHAIADTTNLQSSLDGKAASGHNHDGTYATPGHSHPGGSEAFPVGSVFLAVVSTDPATLLGYGTWSAFGAGKMLVGRDGNDTAFDTVEETGGAKTHGHTVTQPSDHAALTHTGTAIDDHAAHTHSYSQVVNHTHPVTDPGHNHVITSQTATTGSATSYEHGTLDTSSAEAEATEVTNSATTGISTQNPAGGVASGTTGNPSAVLTHTVTQPSQHAAQSHSGAAVDTASHLPPYIVVYMWKRTA